VTSVRDAEEGVNHYRPALDRRKVWRILIGISRSTPLDPEKQIK